MKIAFIVPYIPNQVRTRPYNLITHLSRLGHEVDVFTVGSGEADVADAKALKARCRNVYFFDQPIWRSLFNCVLAVPSKKPLQAVYSKQPGLLHQLKDIFGGDKSRDRYEIVHVEHLRGSEYGMFLKSHFPSLPVVWDSVDCISNLFRQATGKSTSLFGKWVSRFELDRTEKTEANLLTVFDHILVTSGIDRNALLEMVRNGRASAPISVLPNGVDQEYFHPNPSVSKEPGTLVFSGKMSYHANISMVKYLVNEIMPLIWQQRPTIQLFLVGKDPSPEIKKLEDNPRITVTGTVSDIRPFLWKSSISVAPLVYGAGIQNKILEAMAVGLPVVTTSKAILSLGAVLNQDILIGDTPEEFSATVLRLLDNPEWAFKVGEAGRQFVQDNHDWERISKHLAGIYGNVTHSGKADITPQYLR
jgi:polysaccharide biosynthesis protein PslH